MDTSSRTRSRRNLYAASRRWGAAFLVAVVPTLSGFGEGLGQTFLTQDEALELAFPHGAVKRHTEYLTEETLKEARTLAGDDVPINQAVLPVYRATDRTTGELLGTAYFDAHRVRTLNEVVMVVVDPEGRVDRVEVLRFAEPPDYLLPERWLEQLHDRHLDDDLALDKGVINMSGATLSSIAMTHAVRRVLALHAALGTEGTAPQVPRRQDP